MDWTYLMIAGVMLALFLAVNFLFPLLAKNKDLVKWAAIACDMAESLIGSGNGALKWTWALDLLGKLGLNIDSEKVQAALQAAWEAMNRKQIELGLKDE